MKVRLIRNATLLLQIGGVRFFGALGWEWSADQLVALDGASAVAPAYPTWHQRDFPMLNEAAR